jgi:hypothetical protein
MMNRIYEGLILVMSLVVSFVLCEALIRQLPVSDMMGWTTVPPVPERVRAAGPKPAGRVRILVLGDSFTEWRDSTGQSFARVAQRALAAAGHPVDVVNLGQAGTGLTEYFGNLARYGDRLQPDVVVIGLYLGNDLVPSAPHLDTPEGRAAAAIDPPAPAEPGLWWRLAKKSVALNYVFRLAKARVPALRSHFFDGIVADLRRGQGKDDAFVAERLAAADPALVDAARADAINGWDLAGAMFFPTYYDDLARMTPNTPQGDAAAASLRDLDALVAAAGAHARKVMVVLLPPPVWAGERYQAYFRRLGYGRLGPSSGPVPVVERVAAELSAHGIAWVDPLPLLRADAVDTYLPNDEHLDREGQRVVGEALAAALLSRGMAGN